MKNPKVVLFSVLGIICIILSFLVDWLFIIGGVVFMILNQKELIKNKNK